MASDILAPCAAQKFFGFWVFQMIWVWGVCLSVVYINSVNDATDMGIVDSIGAAVSRNL